MSGRKLEHQTSANQRGARPGGGGDAVDEEQQQRNPPGSIDHVELTEVQIMKPLSEKAARHSRASTANQLAGEEERSDPDRQREICAQAMADRAGQGEQQEIGRVECTDLDLREAWKAGMIPASTPGFHRDELAPTNARRRRSFHRSLAKMSS
jgi:hypothetical protein